VTDTIGAAGLIPTRPTADPKPDTSIPARHSDHRLARAAGTAAAITAAAVPFLAEAAFILRSDMARLTATMSDDAFYYLEIARRAARGEGFTFDGLNSTTGFHPLWEWLLIALHRVVPGELAFVQASRLLALTLTATAIGVVARLVWRRAGPLPALGAVLVASHGTALLNLLSDGMETGLVALSLAVLLWALLRVLEDPGWRKAFLLGAATVLVALARLDMVLAIPLVGAVLLWRLRSREVLAGWAVGGALLGAPYALWHLSANAGVLTTSAAIKQRWTSEYISGELGGRLSGEHLRDLVSVTGAFIDQIVGDLSASPLGGTAGAIGAIAVGFLAVLGSLGALQRRQRCGGGTGSLGVAAATVGAVLLVKFVADLWTVPQWVLYWYSVPTRLAVLVAVGAAAGGGLRWLLAERRAALPVALGALTVLALLPAGIGKLWTPTPELHGQVWQMEIQRAADWIREEGPPGTYGAFDAGLLGYRLDGTVPLINLDGLVNDHEFGRFTATGPTRLETARNQGVELLVNDLRMAERESDLRCATTLYQGAGSVRSDAAQVGPDRLYVLDLRPCFDPE